MQLGKWRKVKLKRVTVLKGGMFLEGWVTHRMWLKEAWESPYAIWRVQLDNGEIIIL